MCSTPGQPYEFAGDDPLNWTDPTGDLPHKPPKQGTGKKNKDKHEKGEARQQKDQARSNNPNKRRPQNPQQNKAALVTVTPSAEFGPAQQAQVMSQSQLSQLDSNGLQFSVQFPELQAPPAPALGLVGILVVGGVVVLAFG
jgi:hypothetical protein